MHLISRSSPAPTAGLGKGPRLLPRLRVELILQRAQLLFHAESWRPDRLVGPGGDGRRLLWRRRRRNRRLQVRRLQILLLLLLQRSRCRCRSCARKGQRRRRNVRGVLKGVARAHARHETRCIAEAAFAYGRRRRGRRLKGLLLHGRERVRALLHLLRLLLKLRKGSARKKNVREERI